MDNEKINGKRETGNGKRETGNGKDKLSSQSENINELTLHQAFILLSRRESEILKRRIEGYQNKDIAEECSISLKTVENHISNICKTLSLTGKGNLRKWMLKQRKQMNNGKLNP
jgi:DNA-binding NarL/FixJ family response regulator